MTRACIVNFHYQYHVSLSVTWFGQSTFTSTEHHQFNGKLSFFVMLDRLVKCLREYDPTIHPKDKLTFKILSSRPISLNETQSSSAVDVDAMAHTWTGSLDIFRLLESDAPLFSKVKHTCRFGHTAVWDKIRTLFDGLFTRQWLVFNWIIGWL